MSNHNQQTKEQFIQQLTEENLRKPFEEYPKHLYHPDGRTLVVVSRSDQDARGEEFFECPREAIDAREARDSASSEKFIAKVNAEAKAATGATSGVSTNAKSKKVA